MRPRGHSCARGPLGTRLLSTALAALSPSATFHSAHRLMEAVRPPRALGPQDQVLASFPLLPPWLWPDSAATASLCPSRGWKVGASRLRTCVVSVAVSPRCCDRPLCPHRSILAAPATAELEPLAHGRVSQTDEVTVLALSLHFLCHLPAPGLLRGLLSAPEQACSTTGAPAGSPELSVIHC